MTEFTETLQPVDEPRPDAEARPPQPMTGGIAGSPIKRGDIAAARRIGMWDLPSAAKCPMCGEAHELSQCPRWRVPLAFSDPIAQEVC